ncbi:UPF0260 protein [Alphaproteobacteria bacterium]|nr:UPF0260 protein [Alphaproteobacteria bacterium]
MPSSKPDAEPFWRVKTLAEMTDAEWESLCDGCGKCCLHKLQYEDTGEIDYTDVACHLLDISTCRCTGYEKRRELAPDCVKLNSSNVLELQWMPSSCAYRLLAEGRDLPLWHPLIAKDPDSAHRAGQSIKGRAVPESMAGDLLDHIVFWPA